MPATPIVLYTHPVCSGCQEALTSLSRLAAEGLVELRVRSLATGDGQREADARGVTTVPTVAVGDELVELRRRTDLTRLVDRLRKAGAGEGAPTG